MVRRSRTPQGVRGLKPDAQKVIIHGEGRTPQGVRGLKPSEGSIKIKTERSHSARSAWIETIVDFYC